MFKQIITTLLLLAFIAQVFKGPFILMDYYANKGTFVKNCINKNRPAIKCNGKCQMMKALLAQQKKEQEGIENKIKLKIDSLAPTQIFCSDYFLSQGFKSYFLLQAKHTSAGITFDIKHPPRQFV